MIYKRVIIEGKIPRITLEGSIFTANFRKLIAIRGGLIRGLDQIRVPPKNYIMCHTSVNF